MVRSLLMSLVLAAGLGWGSAYAQSPGYPEPNESDAGEMPNFILPQDMTSPTLSGVESDDAAQGAPVSSDAPSVLQPAPYSVEGEEPLDPGGN